MANTSLLPALFYPFIGGYFTQPEDSKFVKDSVLSFCAQVASAVCIHIFVFDLHVELNCATFMLQLKDEAVAIVDVIAPPDFILQSPIGLSNGQVTLHMI